MVVQDKVIGRGVMRVYAGIWEDIGKPETHEAWRQALLFPDTYQFERVERIGDEYEIGVLSADIPVGDAHISQITVNPAYRKTFHEALPPTVELVEIRLMEWDGEQWTDVTRKEV